MICVVLRCRLITSVCHSRGTAYYLFFGTLSDQNIYFTLNKLQMKVLAYDTELSDYRHK